MSGRRSMRIVLCAGLVALAALSGCHPGSSTAAQHAPAQASTADLAGIWLPDPARAEAWPASLPLTPVGRAVMDHFNPSVNDPTTLCLPLGTPRNMLQTQYPIEIVQTPQSIFIVVQPNLSNTEVRRIPLGGEALPQQPDASWYGTSRGRWEGATLVVETVGLRPDAPIEGNGLPHSEDLRVIERFSVSTDAEHGKVLVDEIELRDPKAFQQPLETRRFFVWAPQAQPREGSCVQLLWIDKLWRDRLQEHAESRRKAGKTK